MIPGTAFIPQRRTLPINLLCIIAILGLISFPWINIYYSVCLKCASTISHGLTIHITLDIKDSHKGSNTALWCNNIFLLSHPKHRPDLEGKIKEFFILTKDGNSSSTMLWCAHKAFMRGILIQLASLERKQRLNSISQLHNENELNWKPITRKPTLFKPLFCHALLLVEMSSPAGFKIEL